MLDLVRLSPRALFPPGGKELYRQIALLTDMDPGDEVLVAACGSGVTLGYFVREFQVQGSGVDEDPALVERAEEWARKEGLQGRMQVQECGMESLPFRDGVFDIVVGELGLTAHADPKEALKEMVRVTKPGGRVALVQLVWKAPVDRTRREVLSRHLGARPLMLVELKRLLRAHGVSRLHTEDWSDDETAFRPTGTKPFPDFAELFSLPEKLGILRRAWGRWGLKGVKTAMKREVEVHRLLTRERILGLDLIVGRKAGTLDEATGGDRRDAGGSREGQEDERETGPSEAGEEGAGDGRPKGDPEADADRTGDQTRDLPLFAPGDES
jgi:SAM-dependent methyltransferase